jgi:hypothetical protein
MVLLTDVLPAEHDYELPYTLHSDGSGMGKIHQRKIDSGLQVDGLLSPHIESHPHGSFTDG